MRWMLRYERMSGEEKVRRAARAAWFEMPQVWVDALRAMPSQVKLVRSAEMWVIMREAIRRRVTTPEMTADRVQHIVARHLLSCDDW